MLFIFLGYRGTNCEECDKSFYKNGILCEFCDCNPLGTIMGTDCLSGICQCKEGFRGVKCDRCISDREFINNGICSGRLLVYLHLNKIKYIGMSRI